MIIGKLIKPCKICIYEQNEPGGEIESYSLLKLSLQEVVKLLDEIENKNKIEYTLDDSIVIQYSGNDAIHNKWKELATEHKKEDPKEFIDVSKKFKSDVIGTSVLIRDQEKHIIKIAKREGDDTLTINRIPIDNIKREEFFDDVKKGVLYKTKGKYFMSPEAPEDYEMYSKWSKFMNITYIGTLKAKNVK